MHKEPELCTELEGIFAQITEIKHKMHDRVKLGTTVATSVPLMLTGKKPKRSDTVERGGEIPQRSIRSIDMSQPHFADILENPALPYYQRKQLKDPSPEKPKVSSAQAQAQPGETSQTIVTTTASPAKDTVSVSSSSQPGAPTHKTLTVSINLGPLGVAQDSSKPARKKEESCQRSNSRGQSN